MNHPSWPNAHLLRTTAVRLALRYVLVYALVLGAALGVLWWATDRHVDSQIKTDLEQDFFALNTTFVNTGPQGLHAALVHRQQNALGRGHYFLHVSREGEKLGGNLLAWPRETSIASDGKVHGIWIEPVVIPGTVFEDDVYLPAIAGELADGSRLLLVRRVEQDEGLHEIAEYLMEILGAAVLLALVLGVSVGHAMLGRMDVIGRTASEIVAGDLSQRVPVSKRNDEFDALAIRLNAMLDRIQQLIKGLHEVTDNVAHDLRSPLTRLRNRLEFALREQRGEQEHREAIAQGIEDTESLIATFDAVLRIAQADAGNRRGQWQPVDLCALANDLAELYGPLAEEQGQNFELKNCTHAEITGSRDLLAQAIGNLLENAIKFTPKGGAIHLCVQRPADAVEVMVSDTGPGIPEAEREHVLERFVRLESSRHIPGNGLGLSLVQAVAKLHGAVLRLDDAEPGLVVTMRFPYRA